VTQGGRSPTGVMPRQRWRNSSCHEQRQVVEVGAIRRSGGKPRMRPFGVIEVQIPPERSTCLADTVIGVQIDLLIFDRPPQPLDKDVVAPRTAAIHADRDRVLQQQAGGSVLKISGRPYLANASSTASRQNSTSIVIDSRQARTRRLNQSTTAAR